MNRNPDSTLQALRPEALDGLAAEAYARRREEDIARALAATSEETVPGTALRTRRRRMPRVLTTGLAAGALAAAAAGVIVATDDSGGPRTPAPAASQRLDARTVLLASAEGAAKAPATTGKYWYTRERETRLVGPARKPPPGSERARKKRWTKSPPVTAYVSTTQDTWSGLDRHERTITGIDRKITFPSAAEEARWRGLGAPELEPWSAKRQVNDYDFSHIKLTRTQRNTTVSALTGLPGDPGALERALRGWYEDENQASVEHDGVPMEGDFAQYVFGVAQDLLAGPITPATKSALFRMLAGQPGITYLGAGTDRLGRRGAVLALKGGTEIRLIIDPRTGRLLEQDSGDRKSPSLVMTYQAMGWVRHLGDRP